MADRLTFDDDGTLDELVLSGAFVHLEHLGGGAYMLIAENEREHVHLTIPVLRRRGVPYIIVVEHRAAPHPEEPERRE